MAILEKSKAQKPQINLNGSEGNAFVLLGGSCGNPRQFIAVLIKTSFYY